MTNPYPIHDAAHATVGSWWKHPTDRCVWVLTNDTADDRPWRSINAISGGPSDWHTQAAAEAAGLIPMSVHEREADTGDVVLLQLTADMLEALGIADDVDYDAIIARIRARVEQVTRDNDPVRQLAKKVAADIRANQSGASWEDVAYAAILAAEAGA
ncbi:hypothetical protein HH308_06450 [Gordonia sp. TBRC 11910]|uniref:Uncharacterized protein n=1 Tax=Gordonia asplenii TaxID=2725283 RepID=A0A848KWL5_9ACTN|nr:hypothetical protein [Gordonia asplenii]NMO00853.1 hypothetical protein [Gordonia asplenii]